MTLCERDSWRGCTLVYGCDRGRVWPGVGGGGGEERL